MTPIGEFLRLDPRDRRLVLAAAALLSIVTLALMALPFGLVRRALPRVAGDRAASAGPRGSPERIARAVDVAGDRLPRGGNCLARAIAGGILLRRHGHPADVTIGVRKAADGTLLAHGWVESDGRVVIGDAANLAAFERLGSIDDP